MECKDGDFLDKTGRKAHKDGARTGFFLQFWGMKNLRMAYTALTDRLLRAASIAAGTVVPGTCHVCGTALTADENRMCLQCLLDLPHTGAHLRKSTRITDRLARYTPVSRHASWFFYRREGKYAALIHDMKYHDMPAMGREMGRAFALEIKDSGFFDSIDLMLPVPLHWTRRLTRGYNQSREIALGVEAVTGICVANNVFAVRRHVSQTRQTGSSRTGNVDASLFGVRRPEELCGRHLLIVDDVVTTGATVDAVACAVWKATEATGRPAAISVLSLGLTSID